MTSEHRSPAVRAVWDAWTVDLRNLLEGCGLRMSGSSVQRVAKLPYPPVPHTALYLRAAYVAPFSLPSDERLIELVIFVDPEDDLLSLRVEVESFNIGRSTTPEVALARGKMMVKVAELGQAVHARCTQLLADLDFPHSA